MGKCVERERGGHLSQIAAWKWRPLLLEWEGPSPAVRHFSFSGSMKYADQNQLCPRKWHSCGVGNSPASVSSSRLQEYAKRLDNRSFGIVQFISS